MQAKQTQPFIEIPIDKGTVPNWETRLGYPQIFNLFVGQMRKLYCTPWLSPINSQFEINGVRAILQTVFGEGAYIVVTNESIIKVSLSGVVTIISLFHNNGNPVQMAENLQNQVGIVDGQNFYVYDQNTLTFTKMGEAQGFVFTSPISIVVLNSVAIVLDFNTGSWAISDVNQMLTFPPLDNVATISSSLTQASSLQTLDDNLYIFGTTGIERWVPNSGNNPYLFPFSKDNNFRVDFGSISINGVQRGFGQIYFLSSKYIPMVLTGRGTESKDIGEQGMAKIIASYPDATQMQSSFYTHEDNFFFHMYFPESNVSWIFCENTGTWANGDDSITCAVPRTETVSTNNGIFNLSSDPQFAVSKLRMWQSERIKEYMGTEIYRKMLNSIEAQIVQGFLQSSTVEPQEIRLKISFDSDSWSNTVIALIGNTGNRNNLTIWRCNLAEKEYTFNMQYQGTYNFVVDRFAIILK